ncbi:hypothetical protein FNH13_15830 [Ornithinimicrobium ciconiae]|uniref:Uncharacterized protein n=1 Tax=Ornithinimicrobium ciconiae TaxID=2594265 RepID=A0A516GDM8_9MICO|nr:hypothetical protein [Ornithinimicrobium ciconiae]QDO89618.1 hypothetical protein FNH13_15830 [Ornithinimicrobium ciconiae]
MPSTSPLPDAPGPDDFRALARSSPWRFGTLHFTHRPEGEEPVEAWLTRPGHLEVVARGERHVETGVPYTRVSFGWSDPGPVPAADAAPGLASLDAEPGLAPPELTEGSREGSSSGVAPQSVEPARRPDGLVVERPDALDIEYDDPMWQNYRWVAMLDPVELSRGVEISDVHARERFGRLTWTASARALPESAEDAGDGYDPRCSCCPLLFGAVSQALEFGAGATRAPSPEEVAGYPSAYWVSLDVETGVVVDVEPQDGDRAHAAFTNQVHEVGGLG